VVTKGIAPPLEPASATLDFGRTAHVYDVRAGEYLGYADAITTNLTPSVAKLYALLPYRVRSVSVDAPNRVQAGDGGDINVSIGANSALGQHVVHIDVAGPDGVARAYYSQNLLVENGDAECRIEFALNDQPGDWEIIATDVATGVSGRSVITLEP